MPSAFSFQHDPASTSTSMAVAALLPLAELKPTEFNLAQQDLDGASVVLMRKAPSPTLTK